MPFDLLHHEVEFVIKFNFFDNASDWCHSFYFILFHSFTDFLDITFITSFLVILNFRCNPLQNSLDCAKLCSVCMHAIASDAIFIIFLKTRRLYKMNECNWKLLAWRCCICLCLNCLLFDACTLMIQSGAALNILYFYLSLVSGCLLSDSHQWSKNQRCGLYDLILADDLIVFQTLKWMILIPFNTI